MGTHHCLSPSLPLNFPERWIGARPSLPFAPTHFRPVAQPSEHLTPFHARPQGSAASGAQWASFLVNLLPLPPSRDLSPPLPQVLLLPQGIGSKDGVLAML